MTLWPYLYDDDDDVDKTDNDGHKYLIFLATDECNNMTTGNGNNNCPGTQDACVSIKWKAFVFIGTHKTHLCRSK